MLESFTVSRQARGRRKCTIYVEPAKQHVIVTIFKGSVIEAECDDAGRLGVAENSKAQWRNINAWELLAKRILLIYFEDGTWHNV